MPVSAAKATTRLSHRPTPAWTTRTDIGTPPFNRSVAAGAAAAIAPFITLLPTRLAPESIISRLAGAIAEYPSYRHSRVIHMGHVQDARLARVQIGELLAMLVPSKKRFRNIRKMNA